MKYTFTALALTGLTAGAISQSEVTSVPPSSIFSLPNDFSLRGYVAWEAKNVFRGIERSDNDGLLQTGISLDYDLPGLSGVSLYADLFNAESLERTYSFGARQHLEWGEIHAGFQHLTAPTVRTIASHGVTQIEVNREFYAGISLQNYSFEPSAYIYYSTDLKQHNFEIAGSTLLPGADIGLGGCEIRFKAYAGICNASTSDYAVKNAYSYLGASVDIAQSLGKGLEMGVGASWAYNNDGQGLTHGSAFWARVYTKYLF